MADLPQPNVATMEPVQAPSQGPVPTTAESATTTAPPAPAPTTAPRTPPTLPSQPPAVTSYWESATADAATRHGVDPQVLIGLIRQESGYAPDVISGARKSSAGALGIAQFMPQTAASYGIDPLNPTEALDGAARYISDNLRTFNGDYRAALAAYNAGAGTVQKAQAAYGADWEQHLPSETQQYLGAILGAGGTTATASANPAALAQPYYQSTPLQGSTALAGVQRPQPSLPPPDFPQPTQPLVGSSASGSPFSPALQQPFTTTELLVKPATIPQQDSAALSNLKSAGGSLLDLAKGVSKGGVMGIPQTLLNSAATKIAGGASLVDVLKDAFSSGMNLQNAPANAVDVVAETLAPDQWASLPVAVKDSLRALPYFISPESLAAGGVRAVPKLAAQAAVGAAATGAFGELAHKVGLPRPLGEAVGPSLPGATRMGARGAASILRAIAEGGGSDDELAALFKASEEALRNDPAAARAAFKAEAERVAALRAEAEAAARRPFKDTGHLRKVAGALADAMDKLSGKEPSGPISQAVNGNPLPGKPGGINESANTQPIGRRPNMSPMLKPEAPKVVGRETTSDYQRYIPPATGEVPQSPNTQPFSGGGDHAPMLAKEQQADVENPHGLLRRIADEVIGTAGTATSAKSILSPNLLRQGLVRLVTAPLAAARETGISLKAAVNEETLAKVDNIISSDPWVQPHTQPTSVASMDALTNPANKGLSWTEVGGDLIGYKNGTPTDLQPEELQMLNQSWLGRKLRESRVGQMSEKQQATSLNLYRTNWYRSTAANMFKAGERRPEEYEKLRKFIEHATQRGSVSQRDLPLTFSARSASGRIQFLGDLLSYGTRGILTGQALQPGVHQEAAKSLIGLTAAGATLFGTLHELGIGKVELNDGLPTLTIGNQHIDPWGGLNTAIKAVVRTGQDIDAAVKKGIAPEDLPQEFTSIVGNRALEMLRSGMAPVAGKIADIISKENYLGRPYNLANDVKSGNILMDVMAPFIMQDIYDAFRQDGVAGVARTAPLSFFSAGVNSYEATKDIGKQEVANSVQSGASPRTYLDANSQPQPVQTREDLRQSDPLAYEKFLAANPKVVAQMSATETQFTKDVHKLQDDSKATQENLTKKYLDPSSPDYNPATWRSTVGDQRHDLQLLMDAKFKEQGEFNHEPRGLLDVANQHLHDAIASATDPATKQIDWTKVDAARETWSPAERDLLDKQSIAGEIPAVQQYKRDLQKLTPYFQQRDEGWQQIFGNSELGKYHNLDEFHQSLVSQMVQAGLPLTYANAQADKAVAPIDKVLRPFGLAYLAQHQDVIPLLDKYQYFIPAVLRPLLLAGITQTGTGVNNGR